MSGARWLGGALAVVAAGLSLLVLAAFGVTSAAGVEEEERRSRDRMETEVDQAIAPGAPSSVGGIDAVMLSAYTQAAANIRKIRPKCSGMRWSVLAGIGKVESEHAAGRTVAPSGAITPRIIGVRLNGSGVGENTDTHGDTDGGRLDGDTDYDRAVGPMQFIPATWNGPSGQDGNHDNVKDPHNAFDATLGAAAYLCGTGTADLTKTAQLRQAIFRYNRSTTYVDTVIGHITTYDKLGPTGAAGASSGLGGKVGAVVDAALSELGTPYVWGGGNTNGPSNGGFDCSGLMVFAFYQGAKMTLPRTSQVQRHVGTKVARDQMKPGDLIVINNNGAWGHVGLYIGNNTMVHAPNPSRSVEKAGLAGEWSQYDWDVRRLL